MAYLSSDDVPFGISLIKLFGCRFGRKNYSLKLKATIQSYILACPTSVVHIS